MTRTQYLCIGLILGALLFQVWWAAAMLMVGLMFSGNGEHDNV